MKKVIESIKYRKKWTKNLGSKKHIRSITRKLDEAEDQISEWEDTAEKNIQKEQEKEKRLRKNKQLLREMQDKVKHNNIHIRSLPEGEEDQRGRKPVWKSNDGKFP